MVGNFRSEKELYELFSRFAGNVRALPSPLAGEAPLGAAAEAPSTPRCAVDRRPARTATADRGGRRRAVRRSARTSTTSDDEADARGGRSSADRRAAGATLPPPELPDAPGAGAAAARAGGAAPATAPRARRALAELVRLLREGDVETLRHTYKTLFARLAGGGEAVRRARRAVGAFLRRRDRARAA